MKYDEYWLYPRNRKIGDPDWEAAFSYPNALSEENGEQIHLIDYAAYTDALKMLEEMAGALDNLTVTIKGRGSLKGTGSWSFKIDGDDWQIAVETLDNYRKWKEGMK